MLSNFFEDKDNFYYKKNDSQSFDINKIGNLFGQSKVIIMFFSKWDESKIKKKQRLM